MIKSALFNLFLLLVAATGVTAQYLNQSRIFSLFLVSNNSSVNGSTLVPCHEGAAIEGLCVTNNAASPSTAYYYFNTTGDDVETEPPNPGATGILSYILEISNDNVTSPMALSGSYTSNVVIPIFTPGDDGLYVAFDSDGKMNIQGYIDDTVYPQVYKTIAYYRWYACITNYLGYTYQTLAWVIGTGEPENPTCVKVDVVRVFA